MDPKEGGKRVLEKRASQGQRGYPLKGPFFALFSQGILTKMNQNAHFNDFCIFCSLEPFFALPFLPAMQDCSTLDVEE